MRVCLAQSICAPQVALCPAVSRICLCAPANYRYPQDRRAFQRSKTAGFLWCLRHSAQQAWPLRTLFRPRLLHRQQTPHPAAARWLRRVRLWRRGCLEARRLPACRALRLLWRSGRGGWQRHCQHRSQKQCCCRPCRSCLKALVVLLRHATSVSRFATWPPLTSSLLLSTFFVSLSTCCAAETCYQCFQACLLHSCSPLRGVFVQCQLSGAEPSQPRACLTMCLRAVCAEQQVHDRGLHLVPAVNFKPIPYAGSDFFRGQESRRGGQAGCPCEG